MTQPMGARRNPDIAPHEGELPAHPADADPARPVRPLVDPGAGDDGTAVEPAADNG